MTDISEIQKRLEDALKSIDNLEKKNSELLGINKKKSEELSNMNAAFEEMKLWKDDMESKKAETEGDLKKQMDILKSKYEKRLSELELKYNEESNYTSKLLVDNNLQEALTKAGVKPELLSGAMALLKPRVNVINENGSRRPVVEDKDIGDFISGWIEADGKAYRHIPQSIGGGAIGSQSVERQIPNFRDKSFNLTDAMKNDRKIF